MLAAASSMSRFVPSSQIFGVDGVSRPFVSTAAMNPSPRCWSLRRRPLSSTFRAPSSATPLELCHRPAASRKMRLSGRIPSPAMKPASFGSADWKAARAYKESGVIYDGRVEGSNAGGLLIRFYSLVGFLPYPLMSPSPRAKPQKPIQDIAKGLVGSYLSVKVIQANEEEKKLIFSEKDAMWLKYSGQVNVGDIFDARVGSVEDYGAFIHLRFPDGCYHLTGLVHVSEVSWDLVQDVRDFLTEGEEIKVKIIQIDREKTRITLSIKQLEDDPLLETLDKVISQEDQFNGDSQVMPNGASVESLPGLESICKELLQEEGISDIRIGRQGLEKRVVSQDLQLWLSNVPAKDNQFTLLARSGRQVQELHLTTTLDQEGIKRAVQRVLGRVE